MAGIGFEFDFRDGASDRLQSFYDSLRNRRQVNEAIAESYLALTKEYLLTVTGARHDTANRLGATPTGHWAQAAEKASAKADDNGATINVDHPGIGRAGHDVEIVPTGGRQYLTIAVIAAAYGRRAREFDNLVFIRTGGAPVLMMPNGDSSFGTIYYVLVKHVLQPQDRTLLPSDEEYQQAALEAMRDYVNYLVNRSRGGASLS